MIKEHENALKVLRIIKTILDELQIPFFLSCGLALGLYRDKAFLDNDLDVGILGDKYAHRAKEIVSAFQKRGIKMWTQWGRGRIVMIKPYKQIYGKIWVDICFYYKEGPYIWKRMAGECDCFDASLFDSFKKIQFAGMTLQIANPPEKYLEAIYGTGWRKKVSHNEYYKTGWADRRPSVLKARKVLKK